MPSRSTVHQAFQQLGALFHQWLQSQSDLTLRRVVSVSRRKLINQVICNRTRSIVPILDQLTDTGNINAILRTAEGLGFQEVHVVRSQSGFKHSKRTTQGAFNWLDLALWDNSIECVQALKAKGYRLLATTCENSTPLTDFDFTVPTALVFGSEKEGVAKEVSDLCDGRFHIPMVGFSQSFNVSVAAALTLYHVVQDRLTRQGFHGDLKRRDRRALTRRFLEISAGRLGQTIGAWDPRSANNQL